MDKIEVYYEICLIGDIDAVIVFFEMYSSFGENLEDNRIIHTYQPNFWIEQIEQDDDIGINYINVKVQSDYYINLFEIQ